jgi:hypothetical protein
VHDRVFAETVAHQRGGSGDRGGRVARHRFEKDCRESQVELACLFGHEEAELLVGQHDG